MAISTPTDGGASLQGEAKARLVQRMFNRIVPGYDLMNRLMTAGMDLRWRRLAARLAQPFAAQVLDIATGTGDLALELWHQGAATVIAGDFAVHMLQVAQQKLPESIPLLLADAQNLPFADASFDCVTHAFLLRNLSDLDAGLREMRRVLRSGGRLVCLEITRPEPGIFAHLFNFYFYRFVPALGGAITGQRAAYHYLPHSLTTFPRPYQLAERLIQAGFSSVHYQLLGFGAVAIHIAIA
ncbi:MAG: ubiquinone/menaquinone biosynthesis methyltransferase [Chloroflexi bacterium]|nr:ubiquinone/menaquinone biosynthesis methyltransferase [Chloroflexota bacterium]